MLYRLILFLILTASPFAFAEETGVNKWIDAAIENNRPLKIALKKIELSEKKLWQARRNLFPEFILSYEERDGEISGLEYDGVSYKGKLTKTIYDGGKSFFALSREEIELEKARKEYKKIKAELVSNVTKAYWKSVRAGRSREIFEDTFGEVQGLVSEAEKIFEERLITQQEYFEIKSQFLKILVRKNTLEKDEKITLLDFRHILNLNEEEMGDAAKGIPLKTEFPFSPIEAEIPGLWELAKKNRLEWQVSYLDKEIKRLNFIMSQRENWPEVGISFSYGSSGEDYKYNKLDLDDEWQVLAKVTFNIGASSLNYSYDSESLTPVVGSFRGEELETHSINFSLLDRLDKDNKILEEEIKLEEASEEKDAEEKRIRREVEEAYYNLKKARVNVGAASEEVSFREKEADIANLKRGLGKSDLVDVIKAKISLGEARISYTEALADHIIAVVELNRAVGGE